MIIKTSNLNDARKIILKGERPLVVCSGSLEFNRKILEFGKFDMIIDLEKNAGRDSPKYLASGLNHIMARIATKNKVAIGFDLERVSKLDKKTKAERLARIRQNIKICRRAKCRLGLLNVTDLKNARDFLISLGASTGQAKNAVVLDH